MSTINENEIARCVRKGVEDYFDDLDGELVGVDGLRFPLSLGDEFDDDVGAVEFLR